jgi:hypothetical protein
MVANNACSRVYAVCFVDIDGDAPLLFSLCRSSAEVFVAFRFSRAGAVKNVYIWKQRCTTCVASSGCTPTLRKAEKEELVHRALAKAQKLAAPLRSPRNDNHKPHRSIGCERCRYGPDNLHSRHHMRRGKTERGAMD